MTELLRLRDLTMAPSSPGSTNVDSMATVSCPSMALPAGGIILLANGTQILLDSAAAFKPNCGPSGPAILANVGGIKMGDASGASLDDSPQASDFRDPFYASTFPQCYALAATTVIAYTLVIMLFVSPKSFLDGGVVVLGRKGFTNGGTGTSIGGRPWLQKVAALTVAISLSIATLDTFRVAENQYSFGIENAVALQDEVLGGTQLKVIRIISGTFLWLAQAQTLIRIFPRHREKVMIKWTALALITLDTIFQSLNSFQYTLQNQTHPRNFTDAVPALSYLFELALGVLYAAWVIYYSFMKKRYAFWHPQMKNMCLMAVLSVTSLLVPIVFFILDVSKPDFAGWGDYVRWVGAAAASVIVWEWVERIEALEREEKKDGILGREVFDGDEMMEMSDFRWPKMKRKGGDSDDDAENGEASKPVRRGVWPSASSRHGSKQTSRARPRDRDEAAKNGTARPSDAHRLRFLQPPLWPSRPPPAVTPISRADSASAASTVYAVRYHPLDETASDTTAANQMTSELLRSDNSVSSNEADDAAPARIVPDMGNSRSVEDDRPKTAVSPSTITQDTSKSGRMRRHASRNTALSKVSRAHTSTTAPATKDAGAARRDTVTPDDATKRWDLRSRLEDFAATQAEKLRERIKPTPDLANLPVRVIAAPPRPGAALAQVREEAESHGSLSRRRNSSTDVGGLHAYRHSAEEYPTTPSPDPRGYSGNGPAET